PSRRPDFGAAPRTQTRFLPAIIATVLNQLGPMPRGGIPILFSLAIAAQFQQDWRDTRIDGLIGRNDVLLALWQRRNIGKHFAGLPGSRIDSARSTVTQCARGVDRGMHRTRGNA